MNNNNNNISIRRDFLPIQQFIELKAFLTSPKFNWHYSPVTTFENEERTSPGVLYHIVHENNIPGSSFDNFVEVISHLNSEFGLGARQAHSALISGKPAANIIIARIRVNLNLRLSEAWTYPYHQDIGYLDDRVAKDWITSILYMNTNNGYTEMQTGERIESQENTLLSFPANMKHRAITQTDTQTRIAINFNYLKMTDTEQK